MKVRLLNQTYSIDKGSERYWLGSIIFIAIAIRVVVALFLGNEVVQLPGTFDQISYDMLAKQFIGGHGLTVAENWWPLTPAGEPTAHWSYLYTFYLVAVYSIFGYHPIIARVLQGFLAGLLMPWLVYRLGRRHFDGYVGLAAAALAAVYIYFVYYAGALMTETFYIMSILWVLDIATQIGRRPDAQVAPIKIRSGLLLGLALATTVLLRQVFLLFIPFLFLWLLWQSYRYRRAEIIRVLGLLFIAGVMLILAILPWTYRNYRAFDTFVMLNTNAGFAFYWGNHPIHGYNFISILPSDGPSYQDLVPEELRGLNEAALDRALLKESLVTIQADPGRYLILSLSRLKDYFKFWPTSESGLLSNASRILSFGILWPFMLYGLIQSGRRIWSSELLILALFVVIYTGIHLMTWALIRYRLPVDAVLLIFASVGLIDLLSRLAQRRQKLQSSLSSHY